MLCISPPAAPHPAGAEFAVAHRSYVWRKDYGAPAGVFCYIDVLFLGGDDFQRGMVERIITGPEGWNRASGAQFRFRQDAQAPVRITFETGGSWSHPGSYGVLGPFDKPTMNFGWLRASTSPVEWRRVVLHEFGHALSLQHTHEQPDVPIPWDREKVYAFFWATNGWDRDMVDAQVLTPLGEEVAITNAWGPSIMAYRIPAEVLTDPAWAIEPVTTLQPLDIDLVQRLYGPPPYVAPPPVPPPQPPPEPQPEPRRVYLPTVRRA